ncbi:MAG: GatB/YqeY domain-containing protein [Candidatus Staskawiczbacteria bacterium]|nr:GatB/YqeY domain-containing protein [Candidatus Staskawiczbacteria bacterium]
MEIKQQIQDNAKEFLKSGDNVASDALRMVLAAIISKEKEKRYKVSKDKPDLKEENLIKESELTNDEVINTLSSEIKKRKDAIVLYEKGNRPELADKEKREIEILQKYLPEQLSEVELKKIIEESINKTGAKEMKDMGKVMADLMPKVKGKADSSEISKIVKEILSGK